MCLQVPNPHHNRHPRGRTHWQRKRRSLRTAKLMLNDIRSQQMVVCGINQSDTRRVLQVAPRPSTTMNRTTAHFGITQTLDLLPVKLTLKISFARPSMVLVQFQRIWMIRHLVSGLLAHLKPHELLKECMLKMRSAVEFQPVPWSMLSPPPPSHPVIHLLRLPVIGVRSPVTSLVDLVCESTSTLQPLLPNQPVLRPRRNYSSNPCRSTDPMHLRLLFLNLLLLILLHPLRLPVPEDLSPLLSRKESMPPSLSYPRPLHRLLHPTRPLLGSHASRRSFTPKSYRSHHRPHHTQDVKMIKIVSQDTLLDVV